MTIQTNVLESFAADRIISSRAGLMLSPSQPALQYFEHVKANSLADKAGIKPGDFLLEVTSFLFIQCMNLRKIYFYLLFPTTLIINNLIINNLTKFDFL